MPVRTTALRKLMRSPTAVIVDKLRSRFWSVAEQRLRLSHPRPGTLTHAWRDAEPGSLTADERDRCLAAANRLLDGRMAVFGVNLQLQRPAPDWHRDPLSGLAWPLRHHSRLDVLDPGRPSDARVVWEINRCQHLIPLAQAFALGGDDRYAQACLGQMEDWIQHNPPGLGINWSSSMEVAIRGVVWCWVVQHLDNASALTADRRSAIADSLWAHGVHICRHLEHEEHSGNHYLANGLGLIVLGAALGNTRHGQHWGQRGREILDTEVLRQFHADGVNYEGSVAYHGLALEIALLAELVLRQAGSSLSAASLDRLERGLDVSLAVTRPDGTYPAIGDVDDGHILPLGPRRQRTHLHLLALGAVLFGRGDLALAGVEAAPEIGWLLGPDALDTIRALAQHPSPPPAVSQFFPQGGLGIQRDQTCHLVVDCADVGSLGRGGHGHADLLSFECFALGQPLVVDSGTFTYSSDPTARERFRGVGQHNTLAVDDRETLEPADLWSFKQSALPRLLRWSTGPGLDIFGARYTLPGQGVDHERWIVFDRKRGAWLIDDRVVGDGVHHPVLRFHVPSRDVELTKDGACVTYPGAIGLCIQRIDGDWARPRVDRSSISPMYRRKAPSSVIVLEGSARLPARCLTALVPYEGQCPGRDSVHEWARSLLMLASPG